MSCWTGIAAHGQSVVEFPDSDVMASVRTRSMGGASIGVAEGAASHLLNPAAVAVRRSLIEELEVDPDISIQTRRHPLVDAGWTAVTGAFESTQPEPEANWQIGANIRYGSPGAAIHFRNNAWNTPEQVVSTGLWSVGGGWSGDAWAVGLMPHALVFSKGSQSAFGFGGAMGGLWSPVGQAWRLGAQLRSATKASGATPQGIKGARIPAQAGVGASWAFGGTNAAGAYGPARHQGAWLGPVVLVASDLVVTGSSKKSVALEPLLRSDSQRTSDTTVSLRVGTEAWLLHQVLRVRAGVYNAPGRGAGPSRVIGTFGPAVKIVEDARGVPIRATGVVEAWSGGATWAIGIETW